MRRKRPDVDVRRLERALCAIADHEGIVCDALVDRGYQRSAMRDVCDALRHIVDGGFRGLGARGRTT